MDNEQKEYLLEIVDKELVELKDRMTLLVEQKNALNTQLAELNTRAKKLESTRKELSKATPIQIAPPKMPVVEPMTKERKKIDWRNMTRIKDDDGNDIKIDGKFLYRETARSIVDKFKDKEFCTKDLIGTVKNETEAYRYVNYLKSKGRIEETGTRKPKKGRLIHLYRFKLVKGDADYTPLTPEQKRDAGIKGGGAV